MSETPNIVQEFEPLPMRKRQLLQNNHNTYRVVSLSGEEKDVVANTAYEAFKLAGVSHALKIERVSNLRQIVIPKQQFNEVVPKRDDVSDSLADIMASEADQFEQIRKLRNPILSADDLDKIMRGLDQEQQPVVVSAPPGTEVHNDGFDEIMPSAPIERPQVPVKEAAKVEQQSASQTVKPESLEDGKELSQEEVDKLLKG